MPPVITYKGKIIWYPGMVIGRPVPLAITGQGLGWSNAAAVDSELVEDGKGLVWTTTEGLIYDLATTEHLTGVLSVLDVSTCAVNHFLKVMMFVSALSNATH